MRRSPDLDELGVEQHGEIFVTVLMLALVKLVNGSSKCVNRDGCRLGRGRILKHSPTLTFVPVGS